MLPDSDLVFPDGTEFHIIKCQVRNIRAFLKSDYQSCNWDLDFDVNAIYKSETCNYDNPNMTERSMSHFTKV